MTQLRLPPKGPSIPAPFTPCLSLSEPGKKCSSTSSSLASLPKLLGESCLAQISLRQTAPPLRRGQEVMKQRSPFISILCVRLTTVCLSLQLVACAAGVDPAEDPVQPSNEENLNENEEDFENNDAEFANDENENFNNEANNTEEVANNSEEENFVNDSGQGNLFGNANNNNNLLGNNPNTGANNPLAPINNLQTEDALVNNAEAEELLTQEGPAPLQGVTDLGPVSPEPSVSEQTAAPAGGGVVRYVMAGGSALHESPNGGVVKGLEQGDHPLVTESGEWSRTSDGYYVPAANLTPRPIGRAKPARQWR